MDDAILFWTQFGAIGQAVGAIATAAAVVVSLWIVLSERRPRVKAQAGLRMIIGGGAPAFDIITITVTNVGLRTVTVSSLGWRTGWTRHGPAWLRYQWAMQNPEAPDDWIAQTRPPFEVAPGQDRAVHIRVDGYREVNDEARREEFFMRKLPFMSRSIPANVCVVVSLVAFKAVITPVEKPLARFLASGVLEGGAGRFNSRAENND
ncbi:MAG: hypothetical protein BroJett013_22890 [Alphaproteobacteria bacterium]|nr:MAG: hypothetical protein BroJett013_22890 [Alphaproteobacteria bacterium]